MSHVISKQTDYLDFVNGFVLTGFYMSALLFVVIVRSDCVYAADNFQDGVGQYSLV